MKEGSITPNYLDLFWSDACSIKGNDYINQIIKQCSVHLLLHGHQHAFGETSQVAWNSPDEHCQICPAGSFGLLDAEPNCLNLIRLECDANRLRLIRVPLEYDPREPLKDHVECGCFRDTGRDPFTASFPLPDGLRFLSLPEDEPTGDTKPLDHVVEQIETILETTPNFRAAWAKLMREENADAPKLAHALADKGLVMVWKLVSRGITRFDGFRDQLRRVLLLLAEGAVRTDEVKRVREQMQSNAQTAIILLQTRYALIAELVLKAAIESEIEVTRVSARSGFVVEPDRLVRLPERQETGIERGGRWQALMEVLRTRFGGLDDLKGAELETRLIGRLKAFVLSATPYFLVHQNPDAVAFPYLREFLLRGPSATVPQESVTTIDEDTLYGLIDIILDETGKLADRRRGDL